MVLAERKPREPLTRHKFKKVLTSWHIYLLSFYYVFISGSMGTPVFPQYLKLHKNPKYTVQQINLYPSGLFAIQAVCAIIYAWISDTVLKGSRWTILFFGAVINLIVWSSLAAWDIPVGWKWACYYLAGQHVGLSGIVMTWANEICTEDAEERAIVLATMNTMVGVVSAWLPLIVWQQVEAPRYHKGFITASCMGAVALFIIPAIKLLQDKEPATRRGRAIEARDDASESGAGGEEDVKKSSSDDVTPSVNEVKLKA